MKITKSFLFLAIFALFSRTDAMPQILEASVDFAATIERAKENVQPAVLYVQCITESTKRGKLSADTVSGSAFVISPDGEFITNWHVVDKATSVRCMLSDGRNFEAEVLGSDKSMDIALCRLKLKEGETVPYTKFGDSTKLTEGSFVIALGAPWGLNRSLTFGTVSCARRYLDGHSEYVLWIQTDANIGPGNSGGPLVNTQGEVIGINALGTFIGVADFGFAIPAESAKVIIKQLREHGKVNWSWSGLLLQPLRDFQRDMYFDATNGVIVSGTAPDSPARAAGFLPSDRVERVNGTPVNVITDEDLPDVRMMFGLLPETDDILCDIVRGGEPMQIVIKPNAKGAVEGKERDFPRWDFSAKEINQFETPDLFFRMNKGVYVFACKDSGNAERVLAPNDIIVSVNGQPIETLADLAEAHKKAIDNIGTSHKAMFNLIRNGRNFRAVMDFLKDNK